MCVQQEHMDQHFQMLREQITESNESVKKLQEDIQREVSSVIWILDMCDFKGFTACFQISFVFSSRQKHKANPADSFLNSVTVVLLCLWFIVLYYGKTSHSVVFVVFVCVNMHSLMSIFVFPTSLQLLCGKSDANRSAGQAEEQCAWHLFHLCR